MANESKIKDPVKDDPRLMDLRLEKFTEPDVSKSVAEAQQAPRVIGKMMTILILVPLIIVGILFAKEKKIIDKMHFLIKKALSQNGNVISKPATVIWKKKPHQYGREPEKRTSGYLNATLTKDSDTKFCFTVHVGRNEDSHYNGRKVGGDRIKGSWRNPPDGGKWYLDRDKNNLKLYKGGINDPYLSDWAYFELEILD